MKNYFVYLLYCSDNTYYTGVTNNIERRFAEHSGGHNPKCYTFKRRPLKLVFVESFTSILDALEKEKQIKKWGRKKKEALIEQDYEKIVKLAKKNQFDATVNKV